MDNMVHDALVTRRDRGGGDTLREVLNIERGQVTGGIFGTRIIVEAQVMVSNCIDHRHQDVIIHCGEHTHHV